MTTADDRLPPHSGEAEAGVLGCLLLSPDRIPDAEAKFRGSSAVFFDLRNRHIFEAMVSIHRAGARPDSITIADHLRGEALLEEVGGLTYLSGLPEQTPSADHWSQYADIIYTRFTARRLLAMGTDLVQRSYEVRNGKVGELIGNLEQDLVQLRDDALEHNAPETYDITKLSSYDFRADPNTILGVHNGVTTRYLCRGGSAWLIGPSGIGKSSLHMQMALCWATGQPAFGITPTRPLRCLIVQAENDIGDLAEQVQGILDGLGINQFNTEDEWALGEKNLRVVTETTRVGAAFCQWLRREITLYGADLVILDPFLSFAGIDVSKQDQCTQFLRAWLNPVLKATGAVVLGIHHTGKPKTGGKDAQKNWTIIDHAYAGLGSSELVNWARAVMVLRQVTDDHFELRLAKRGQRARAIHPDGSLTTSIWLRHGQNRLCWEQQPPPQEPTRDGPPGKRGRKNKLESVLQMDLKGFFGACPEGGESKRQLAKRLEQWLATERIDATLPSCRRAIEDMVESGQLTKIADPNEAHPRYIPGPNQ